MLSLGDPNSLKSWEQAIVARIQAAQQPDEVDAFALGAFAAALFPPRVVEVTEGPLAVLIAARQRAEGLGISIDDRARLFLMCEKIGI
jgi:hypothetical protein